LWVFRKVVRGAESAHSDINVLVVGELDFAEVVTALHPCQEMLGREINPAIYAATERGARVARGDVFARDILSRPVLLLIGELHDA
jgi:predicted nucleotidyltransferase